MAAKSRKVFNFFIETIIMKNIVIMLHYMMDDSRKVALTVTVFNFQYK